MSTLSSWIDPAEISELLPFLLPQEGSEEEASAEEKAGDDFLAGDPETEAANPAENMAEATPKNAEEDVVKTTSELSASEKPDADRVETIAVIDARPGVNSVPAADLEIDFNTPDAYDAAAFPEAGGPADKTSPPDHQAAAVQAASALERARSRADEFGLLKKEPDISQSVGTPGERAAGEGEKETKVEERPVVEDLDEPSIPSANLEVGDVSDSTESRAGRDEMSELKPEPGIFRDRMANFARNAVQLTGGSDPAVTDFQSYPLFPAAKGNRCSSPETVDSILKMNRLIDEFPGRQKGDSESTTQIALAEGQWLCILTRDSASGGVCASLQVPEPVAKETAAKLHQELSAALAAPSG